LTHDDNTRSEGGPSNVPQKVLIIDDSEMIHGLVKARLKDEPVELLFAADGVRGLEVARAHAPDVILLDVDMPEPDGFEVCRRLKADPLTREIAVIFLTGASSTQQKLMGLELGAVDYVVKPFDPAELRARVKASLRTRQLLNSLQASEERFRFLAENSSDMISRHGAGGVFLYASPSARSVLGYEPEELVGRSIRDFVHTPDAGEIASVFGGTAQNVGATTFRARRKDGRVIWLESTARVVRATDSGHAAGATATEYHLSTRDVTLRKEAETLEQSRTLVLQMIAENRPLNEVLNWLVRMVEQQYPAACATAVLLLDGRLEHTAPNLPSGFKQAIDGHLLRFATAMCDVDGREEPTVVHDDIATEERWAMLRDAAARFGLVTCWSIVIRSSGGEVLGFFAVYHPTKIAPDRSSQAVLQTIGKLVTVAAEHQALTYQLAYRAQHDSLTGLPNRLLFEDRLTQALVRAQGSNGKKPVALLCMDLDRFKFINDTLGHHAGDALLVQYARRVEGLLRQTDTLARLGGDEFACVLPDVTRREDATKVAQAIIDALKDPFEVAGHELFVTGSIGVAVYPYDASDTTSLQKNADLALDRAKSMGRNRHECFVPDMSLATSERLSFESQLRNVLKSGELVLHYQPQVVPAGRLVGLEALVRWNHPTLGLLMPGKFISLAEETGFILSIGEWVLDEACRQNKAWQTAGYPPVRVAVNVSALQFAQPNFSDAVAAALDRHHLDPQWLELEITESLLMKHTRETAAKLEVIRDKGVAVSLDDFGTGYSSLAYLQQLPIDTLKIDRSFVRQIEAATPNSGSLAVIRAIASLGNSLGMHVVAEGVETEHQRELLCQAGCDGLQGYLFGKPGPAAVIEEMMRKQSARPAA
jgi:diguanylate cyclase (GGDEF)-like protein/PAS domain S-box-containing protein